MRASKSLRTLTRSEEKETGPWPWLVPAVLGLIGVILGAFAAVVGASIAGDRAAATARDEALRASRTVAYGEYLGAVAAYTEHLYGSAHLTGEPDGLTLSVQLWEPARPLRSEFESSYSQALLVAGDDDVAQQLLEIREEFLRVVSDFSLPLGT